MDISNASTSADFGKELAKVALTAAASTAGAFGGILLVASIQKIVQNKKRAKKNATAETTSN